MMIQNLRRLIWGILFLSTVSSGADSARGHRGTIEDRSLATLEDLFGQLEQEAAELIKISDKSENTLPFRCENIKEMRVEIRALIQPLKDIPKSPPGLTPRLRLPRFSRGSDAPASCQNRKAKAFEKAKTLQEGLGTLKLLAKAYEPAKTPEPLLAKLDYLANQSDQNRDCEEEDFAFLFDGVERLSRDVDEILKTMKISYPVFGVCARAAANLQRRIEDMISLSKTIQDHVERRLKVLAQQEKAIAEIACENQ